MPIGAISIDPALEWMEAHGLLLTLLTVASLVVIVASMALAPMIVTRIPHDYFAHRRRPAGRWSAHHPVVRVVLRIVKNAAGGMLMLAGAAMLVLPGQGLLTMFVGFLLIEFPGKYRFEKWLVSRGRVLGAINWLRRRAGREAMVVGPSEENGGTRRHWEGVYAGKRPDEVSWAQDVPRTSLALIEAALDGRVRDARPARVIDVGAGASRLVDHLVERGVEVCIVDVSGRALAETRRRLGERASDARLIEADVTRPIGVVRDGWADVWHDRAAFHFLTEPEARRGYVKNLLRILAPGGAAVIATFAPDGPEKCSGLPVRRYDGASMLRELSAVDGGFTVEREEREAHVTPRGATQRLCYSVLRRVEPLP